MADRRLPRPWPAVMALACAALTTSPAPAADWTFRHEKQARVQVNDGAPTNARLLVTDAPGIYLVELPFESKFVLVDLPSRSAILLMRSEVRRVKNGGQSSIVIDQRSALGTSSYTLHSSGQAFDFQTDISAVHVDLPAAKSGTEEGGASGSEVAPAGPPPEAAVVGAAAIATESPASGVPPVADSAAARACVRLETNSTPTPGCTRSVYVRNSCDRPVIAFVSQTQYLMSGSLADTVSVPVPPNGERWVACAWWSGAMAPARHDLVGAGFPEPPAHHGQGGHHGDKPR